MQMNKTNKTWRIRRLAKKVKNTQTDAEIDRNSAKKCINVIQSIFNVTI